MINYEKYFSSDIINEKYYDSMLIIKVLEDIMAKSFRRIKVDVENCNVFVDGNEIEKHLNRMFEIENLQLKQRAEESKKTTKDGGLINFDDVNLEYIKNSSQEFIDGLETQRYAFSPYTLEYFKNYVKILKIKISKLLDLIEKIAYKDSESIQNLIDDLDISLDDDGNILKMDIIRLISPTIYNINVLYEKVTMANDLSTYLTFKMTKYSLYRDGFDESELYPSPHLQIKSLISNSSGCIPLSENQKEELMSKYEKSMKKTAKLISGCFD